MKVTLYQLPKILAQKLTPIYFISGDEILLIEEAKSLIRKAALEQEFTEHDIFHVEKGFAWQSLLSAIKNFSLFNDKKIIELHLSSIKLETAGIKIIEDYLGNPALDKILIIITPKLTAGWQKTKWLKTVEEKYVFLQVWPVEARELPMWIEQRIKSRGLSASFQVCKLLAEQVEGNLLAAAQEIEKLAILYGQTRLDVTHIEAVTDSSHYNIFGLVDAALQGDAKKVVEITLHLQAEGEEPILLLWALSRELRTLINILKNKNSMAFEKACQNEQVLVKRVPLVKNSLLRLQLQELEQMLVHAAKIDLLIKGVIIGNVWQELLQLALNLAGVK